ncbi:MAG: hypothetical protein KA116_01695 [Proteobacteria bacterium]|nr:hypothetical protein [Pseudomonadota bacterium]
MKEKDENSFLSKITFISSLGDFISYFAVLVMVNDLSKSVAVAAYSITIRTMAVALGGACFPYFSRYFSTKKLILSSQLLSGVVIAILALYWTFGSNHSVLLIFALLFIETFLKQIFDGAKEVKSKSLGDEDAQRGLQAQLLHGFYGAQFWGPIASFFLLKNLPLVVPLWIDVASFFIAMVMASRLSDSFLPVKYKLFAPLNYLKNNKDQMKIFFLRSVGMWVPIGIFNYMLFPTIQSHYGLELINSAWVYVAIGLGSMIATGFLKEDFKTLRLMSDWKIAAIGFFALGLTRFAFISLPTFPMALAVLAIGGICNGANATATQSIRRKVTTTAQLPEFIGLELLVGRVTDIVVSTICFLLLQHQLMTYKVGMILSAVSLFALGIVANQPSSARRS